MSGVYDQRLNFGELQWKVFQDLFADLNYWISDEESRGRTLDNDFNELTGRRLVGVTLDRIKPSNFHMGHRPSLIEAPVSEWPAISIMAYSSVPSPINSTIDRADANRMTVSIECICAAGPYKVNAEGQVITNDEMDGEEMVDRKIKRTAEAIHSTMMSHREDAGSQWIASGSPPTVTFGEVFIRDTAGDGTDRKGRHFWQGVRFQYTYEKMSMFDFDVDQS